MARLLRGDINGITQPGRDGSGLRREGDVAIQGQCPDPRRGQPFREGSLDASIAAL